MNYILVSYIPNCIEILGFFCNMKIPTFWTKNSDNIIYIPTGVIACYLDNLNNLPPLLSGAMKAI